MVKQPQKKKKFNRFFFRANWFCLLCKYGIRDSNKCRRVVLEGKPKRVCMSCTSTHHKILRKAYKSCDLACSLCSKVVSGNACIHCSTCNCVL